MGFEPDSLIAEQLAHTLDLMRAEIASLRQEVNHQREITDRRLAELEKCNADYELRMRQLQETSTQFRLLAGLATGGGLLSIISLLQTLLR